MSLTAKLGHSKQKLVLMEKENDLLRELRNELYEELMKVNSKVKEAEVLNKYLLENCDSREELFGKILGQVKLLMEMKAENGKKNEKATQEVMEFLMKEQKDKELQVEQAKEMTEFLEKVKEQIDLLKVPNFENLIKNKVDLELLKIHNQELSNLKIVEEDSKQSSRQSQNRKNVNYLRRSVNYSSTGKGG